MIARVRQVCKVELALRALFEAPTVAGLSQRVEAAQRAALGVAVPNLERAEREGELPLSFAQQRLWFLDQLAPQQATYNMPLGMRIKGQLRVLALEQALSEIVRRHESLRTSFPELEGAAQQQIAAPGPFSLPVIDLRDLAGDEQQAQVERLAREEAERAFDLASGPLLRVKLLQLASDEQVVLLTMHHIISDGWSMGVLVKEVGTLYSFYSGGAVSPLAELGVQYADYAVWQREWLQGETLEQQVNYWREQLAGAPPVLELPTDRRRAEVRSQRGEQQSVVLSAELTRELQKLSRAQGVTLFMTLLASWQLLLSRYARQEQVVVGTPIAGRQQLQTEELIGFFVNTLVLHTDLSGDPSFGELLERVREVALAAYAHQDVPFEKLVEELQPERSLSHTPLFQVMFVLQNTRREDLEVAGLSFEPLSADTQTALFDMSLSLEERGGLLGGRLEYNADLFESSTIEHLLTHFQRLLESIVSDPAQRISELQLLTPAEERQLLVEWNETQADYPREHCVHELFEEQVTRTPDAVALIYEDDQLSYAEVNCRANQLAHYLRSLGVGPESLVGILMERSVEMVVALLGVLKAGAAYVPLDPDYPRERLAFILEDTRSPVLLTQEKLRSDLPAHAEVVCLDTDWKNIEQQPSGNPVNIVTAKNLAYLIYTSGSTGKPKAVMIEHGSVANLAAALNAAVYQAVHAPLRVGLNAVMVFDASVKQLVQLLNGHCLAIVPEEVRQDAGELLRYVTMRRIDVLDCTPTQLKFMQLTGAGRNAGKTPPYMLVGGEALDEALWQTLSNHPETAFYNVYGPTECTVDAAISPVNGSLPKPTIGRPVTNVQMYLLDQHLHPAPVGVPGELCISGVGLARGYLNQADATAEKFIPNPFSSEPGARLYKTGDLSRYFADGNIDLVGRLDNQVKVRGFRIELGEIEIALTQHEAVRDCTVIVREDVEGDERLVAYVVRGSEQGVSAGELRGYLKERLPEYMIPGAYVELEQLPLTPNGKVDRRALPAPGERALASGDEFLGPRTPLEEVMCGIWMQVLRVERVSIRANFFELGGHSLLATQVIARVRQVCKVELALRALFEAPTVAGLSERVAAAQLRGQGVAVPELRRAAREGELPLSFAQQRLWFLEQLAPQQATYNMPMGVRIKGQLREAALAQAVSEIVRRHESLRTSFPELEGAAQQQIGAPGKVSLPLVDLSGLAGREQQAAVERLAREEAQRAFDLASGPLLRVWLLQLGRAEYVVLLTMHHIISDGWSMGVLVREVSALYAAYSAGEVSPLAELGLQYVDYAVWQREWLQGETLAAQVDYWREQLAGAPPVLELPTDRRRGRCARNEESSRRWCSRRS